MGREYGVGPEFHERLLDTLEATSVTLADDSEVSVFGNSGRSWLAVYDRQKDAALVELTAGELIDLANRLLALAGVDPV